MSDQNVFFAFFMLFFLAFLAIGIALLVFWIIMLIDVAGRKFKTENEKIMWILLLVFLGGIGALVYYFAIKRKDKLSPNKKAQNSSFLKSSIVYLLATLMALVGLFIIPFGISIGLLVSVVGIVLLILNLIMVIQSKHDREIKAALIVPKVLFLVFMVLMTIIMVFIKLDQ